MAGVRTGERIRATHPYGFRCGEWATITGQGQDGPRELYQVTFDDGVTDWWVVDDPNDPYEFRVQGKAERPRPNPHRGGCG